jgi:hypothetical protein
MISPRLQRHLWYAEAPGVMLVRPATICRHNSCIEQRTARGGLAIAGEIESDPQTRTNRLFPFQALFVFSSENKDRS